MEPAPPDAITGTFTASTTLFNSSKSKPSFTPSVSMLLTTISPAPLDTPSLIRDSASIPVFSRPPFANIINLPSTLFMSQERTTHWFPYFFAASSIKSGFLIAPLFTLTLSAPHFRTLSKSSSEFIPPPTVRGIKTLEAVSFRMSVKISLFSAEAVMS